MEQKNSGNIIPAKYMADCRKSYFSKNICHFFKFGLFCFELKKPAINCD